ncbi:uncharacterized mitochondrial protein AtMg00810-like [Gossypium hirsutum]|uniref:Uncharacterized mitochondrial protein AtMg00810-like n=1 Tax=Gossypium hirsutum TaxID=3635 RepID=A0A1U8I1D6_GOSHI|nr:uncharacterized mitochondrial protein AtMg00810-like [Gossypium hirsutum]
MKMIIVSLYIDDLIVSSNDEQTIIEFRNSMKNEFDMTNLGRMRYFLGIEVLQKSDGIFINQNKYASDVLKHFGMDKSNFVQVPLAPGFKFSKDEDGVKVDKTYYKQVVKRALRYLKGTTKFGIFYKKGGEDELVAYTDSDYVEDTKDRKSTSGYVFLLSSGAISWSSKKQPVVSLSTIEVEFVATTLCAFQAVWLQRVMGVKTIKYNFL